MIFDQQASASVQPLRTGDVEGDNISDVDRNSRQQNSLDSVWKSNQDNSDDISMSDVVVSEFDEDSADNNGVDSLGSEYDSVENSSDNDESNIVVSLSQNRGAENELLTEIPPTNEQTSFHIEDLQIQHLHTKLSYLAVMGMLRYSGSYVALLFSTDLIIVYTIDAWVTLSQKWGQLEHLRLLRSDRRWGALVLKDSINRFHSDSKKTVSWAQYVSFFHAYEVAARETDLEFHRKWVGIAHQAGSSKLPPYYRLCLAVQKELIAKMKAICCFGQFSILLSFVIAFSGIGHLLTIVGRKHWGIVSWKYFLFACACLGIWTDEIYEAYEIEDLVREFSIADPEEATILFIPLTIASRVILLQALGGTATLISIVVINLCGAPLFVFSPKMRKIIPPLIHLNPREVAVKREKIELLGRHNINSCDDSIHLEEWVIRIRALSIFFTESRLLVFFNHLVSLSLTIIILKDIKVSNGTIALLMVGMLPYFIGSALIAIMYVGKRLKLTDSDFQLVFSCFLVLLPTYVLSSRARFSTSFQQEEVVIEPRNIESNSIEIDVSDGSSILSDYIAPLVDDLESISRSSCDISNHDKDFHVLDGVDDLLSHDTSIIGGYVDYANKGSEEGSEVEWWMDRGLSDRNFDEGRVSLSLQDEGKGGYE
eukprot:gene21492-27835_t